MICKVKRGTIYYETYGEGFPIVIMHGLNTDHRSMKSWLEPIFQTTTGFKRIYIDLPAHGHSDIDRSINTTDDLLKNVLECIHKLLPNETYHLIGSSFGGYIAQGVLHTLPSQVKDLCLLAPVVHVKNRTLPEKEVIEVDEELLSRLYPTLRKPFEMLFSYQNKRIYELFMEEIQPGMELSNKRFLSIDWREKGYFFAEEPFYNMSKLRHRLLLILGNIDAIVGYKDHQLLLKKFPNAKQVLLAKAGHLLQVEQRELVQKIVKDWLNEKAKPKTTSFHTFD